MTRSYTCWHPRNATVCDVLCTVSKLLDFVITISLKISDFIHLSVFLVAEEAWFFGNETKLFCRGQNYCGLWFTEDICHCASPSMVWTSVARTLGLLVGIPLEAWMYVSCFLFCTASRTALEPTQPPIQGVLGTLSLEVKRPGREADHSPPSSVEVKEWVELYFHSPIRLHGVVLS
jgi:hypothetical protein